MMNYVFAFFANYVLLIGCIGPNHQLENSALNPLCANPNKSGLLFSSAKMFKKPLWQSVWTQIRLLL